MTHRVRYVALEGESINRVIMGRYSIASTLTSWLMPMTITAVLNELFCSPPHEHVYQNLAQECHSLGNIKKQPTICQR